MFLEDAAVKEHIETVHVPVLVVRVRPKMSLRILCVKVGPDGKGGSLRE